jgi:hypothetical protein
VVLTTGEGHNLRLSGSFSGCPSVLTLVQPQPSLGQETPGDGGIGRSADRGDTDAPMNYYMARAIPVHSIDFSSREQCQSTMI